MESAFTPPPPLKELVRRDWVSRNWKWLVPVLVLVLCLMGAGVFFMIMNMLKSSEPYQHAVSVALSDPRTAQLLGSPVEPGWLVTGEISTNSGKSKKIGNAEFSIPLHGAKHSASLHVYAVVVDAGWAYKALWLEVDDSGERIDFLRQPDREPPKN